MLGRRHVYHVSPFASTPHRSSPGYAHSPPSPWSYEGFRKPENEKSYTIKLQQLLEPFGITKFYTDGWGAYERHIDAKKHHVGRENTQKIESKHINLRTRIKRLVRRTLCFSKTEQMHDLVIGLFINRYAFGRAI